MAVRTGTNDEVIGEGIEAPIDMPPKENVGVWTQGDVDTYSNLDKTMGIKELTRWEVFAMLLSGVMAGAYWLGWLDVFLY